MICDVLLWVNPLSWLLDNKSKIPSDKWPWPLLCSTGADCILTPMRNWQACSLTCPECSVRKGAMFLTLEDRKTAPHCFILCLCGQSNLGQLNTRSSPMFKGYYKLKGISCIFHSEITWNDVSERDILAKNTRDGETPSAKFVVWVSQFVLSYIKALDGSKIRFFCDSEPDVVL